MHQYCRQCAGADAADSTSGSAHRAFAGGDAREHLPRSRTFDVRHVRLELAVDERRGRISGSATLTLHPIHELRLVELDAVDLQIRRVSLGGRRDLEFVAAPEVLVVMLDRAYSSEEVLDLSIEYDAEPCKGLYFIRPDKGYPKKPFQVWSQGESEDNRYWFPCWDFPNDKCTSEVLLTVRDRYTALSNGRLVSATHDRRARKRTFHWRQDVPHTTYLISIVVGEFVEVSDRSDGIPVRYYVRKGEEAAARPTFGKTPDILRFFAAKIGHPYPYAKYAQAVLSDFMWGGMENTSLTTINERALVTREVLDDVDSDGLVAHELAHQWWGDLLTTKTWEHLWLNEGFATYFDALYTEHRKGPEEFALRMLEFADHYYAEDGGSYRRSIVTRNYRDPEDLFDRHSYQKAAWVLHMLRFHLGDALWWKAINHYVHKHRCQSVETSDFKIAIEEATGQALDAFFSQWLYKSGHPEFTFSWKWDAASSRAAVTVKQTQAVTGDTPVFRTSAIVRVYAQGGCEDHPVEIERSEHVFWFAATVRPDSVQLDPDGWLLKRLRAEKPTRELAFDLRRSPGVSARMQAARWMGRKEDQPGIVSALAEALLEDGFHGVRSEAAAALGEIRSDSAFAALQTGRRDRHPKVRRAIARALGRFRSPAAARLLRDIIRRDRSDFVVAEAVRALARTRQSGTLPALRRAFRRRSFHDVVAGAAMDGLAELQDPRGIALAERGAEYGRPFAVRTAAIQALGRLWEHADGKAAAVRERLEDLLRDPDHSARRCAANALAQVLDDQASSALQRHAESEPIGILRKVSRDALRRLRERRSERGSIGRITADIDRLKDENRALRNRMASMEARWEEGKEVSPGRRRRRRAPSARKR